MQTGQVVDRLAPEDLSGHAQAAAHRADDPRLTLRFADLLATIRCLDQLIQNHCLSE
jgi:hypothetical protein